MNDDLLDTGSEGEVDPSLLLLNEGTFKLTSGLRLPDEGLMGLGDFVSPSLARIAPAAAAEADFGVTDDAGVTLTPVFLDLAPLLVTVP